MAEVLQDRGQVGVGGFVFASYPNPAQRPGKDGDDIMPKDPSAVQKQ